MFVTKFLVPAFAVFGFAAAQSSACTATATKTIQNAIDATNLGTACTKFTGSIAIAPSVLGPIDFGNLQQISGNLVADGAVNMTLLKGDSVNAIGGTMFLKDLTILSSLSFQSLKSVGGITFITVPNLQSLTFTKTVTKATDVLITDTGLTTLSGIDLMTVGALEITNNGALRTFTTQIVNITTALTISGNGLNLQLSFPNLLTASNMTVRNISALSIPSLASVGSTFGVYSSSVESIIAPNLTSVGGDLAIVGDPSLTNISMPSLKSIGGALLIANDTSLLIIDGFPNLARTGALNIAGNYTTLVLPALTNVAGTANLQSSGNFSCEPFNKYAANRLVIKGQYFCLPNSNNVQTTIVGTATGATTSATSSAGAAVSLMQTNLPAIFGLTVLIGGFMMLGGMIQLL